MTNPESDSQNTAQSKTQGTASDQSAANPSRTRPSHAHKSIPKRLASPNSRSTAGSSLFGGSAPPANRPPGNGNDTGGLPEPRGLEQRDIPYLWPSWLAKLVSGEDQCEFRYWLKANYKYPKRPGNFDSEQYKINHNRLLQLHVQQLLRAGWQVRKEDQNAFTVRGKTANIGGKPDIVALGQSNTIGECKTGQRKPSDVAQLKIYMLLAPMAKLHGMTKTPDGLLIYCDEIFEIPSTEIDASFKQLVLDTIAMLASPEPPAKAASARECRFCDIPISICADRLESGCEVETDLF